MTREEIIKALNEIKECPIGLKAWYIVALEMAIKALENHDTFMKYSYSLGKHDALSQEPCTDAVSREAVKEIINDIRDCISVEGYCAIIERLKKLPPVNPKPCDDAISRKDVINAIDKWISEYKPQHYLIQSIRNLPSVTQKGDVKNV